MNTAEATRQLHELLARLDEFAGEAGPTPAFLAWREEAEAAIRRIFGDESREVAIFLQVRYTPLTHAACLSDEEKVVAFQRGVAQARFILESLVQRLERPGWPD